MFGPAGEATVVNGKAAEYARLTYVSDDEPGIRRKRSGRGFRYETAKGGQPDGPALQRIKSLAIPPAWTDVWICPQAAGHIQATGRDARGRKQYRYHPRFRDVCESTKYHHMIAFADNLPTLRRKVQEHLSMRGVPREKVLATVVHLLEATLIRIGSDEYARTNKSYGLTTLKNRHVEVDGCALKFNFKGKSGKTWKLDVRDRRIAKVIRACQDLPGQDLFQYVDDCGKVRDVTSSDVNAYLRESSGQDITAKDFRTWHGTVLAVMALRQAAAFDSPAEAKRNIRRAIETVAERLGNTPTICRRCYVHPEIIACYEAGSLLAELGDNLDSEPRNERHSFTPEEAAVLTFLRRRFELAPEAKMDSSLKAA